MSKKKAPQPAQDASNDQRRAPRVRVKLEVTTTSDSNLFVGFTDNLSEGGIFVATHQMVNIGEQIDLEFELPGTKRTVRLPAVVRWQCVVEDQANDVKPGFGACFTDLGEEDQQILERFVKTRAPLFHPD